MTTELYELDQHVFEVTCDPGDEVPGNVTRELSVRLVSGPPLTEEQWGRLKESVVRDLIAKGSRVYRVWAT